MSLDERTRREKYNTRDVTIICKMGTMPTNYDKESIGFLRMSDELSRIDTWLPLAYHDAKFLLVRFQQRGDGSSGTSGATTFYPPWLAIAQCHHRRSILGDSIYGRKEGAQLHSLLCESSHGIQCTHAFILTKLSENVHRIATLEILFGYRLFDSTLYVNVDDACRFVPGKDSNPSQILT